MKRLYKIPFLAVFLLFSGAISAQILSYDFENLNVGDKVAETLGEPWTTWNLAPGGDEDAVVSNEYTEGARSMKIDNGNDIVLKLGDKTTGAYTISFDMYIPEGKEGYFNVLHEFNQTSPNNSNRWAFEIFFKSEEHGNYVNPASYYSEGIINPFDVPYDEWFNVKVNIDVDCYYIVVEINNTVISQLAYTACSVAAMNFFTDVTDNEYFVDNISFNLWDETFVHNIVPQNGDINLWIATNHLDTITYRIMNEGNSVGNYAHWIDYGLGMDNEDELILHKDKDPRYIYGNYNGTPYLELGVLFNAIDMIDSLAIGRKVIGMQYPIPYLEWFTGPITFRIYKYVYK